MKAIWISACALALCYSFLTPQLHAQKYTPTHPEVVRLIESATAVLVNCNDAREGAMCLAATALLKANREKYIDDPLMDKALAAARKCPANSEHIYDEAMAIIFLCEYDSVGEAGEIDRLMTYLLKHQKGHGGFGYEQQPTGDTSQTQYAVLAMWTAMSKKIKVPVESMERVTTWLVRTQDPTGGWGYQGRMGQGGRVPQEESFLIFDSRRCG